MFRIHFYFLKDTPLSFYPAIAFAKLTASNSYSEIRLIPEYRTQPCRQGGLTKSDERVNVLII